MSGLDNSQPLTDEQSLKEGHVGAGDPSKVDEAADQLGKDVRAHSEDEAHKHPH